MTEWYETYGDKHCLKCQKLLCCDNETNTCVSHSNFCVDHASDVLLGIPSGKYPKPSDFLKDCKDDRIIRAIAVFPHEVKPRTTRVFLFHHATKEIFAYFLLNSVMVGIAKKTGLSQYLHDRLVELTVNLKVGGIYLTSFSFLKIVKQSELSRMLDNTVVVLDKPVRFDAHSIRSFIYVDGDKILAGAPATEFRWNTPKTLERQTNFKSLSELF